jgi:hypothetical protein
VSRTWLVVFLAVAFLLCLAGFAAVQARLGGDVTIPDSRLCYSPEEVRDLFTTLKDRGVLRTYGLSLLSLDLVFPVVYGSLLVLLMSWTLRDRLGPLPFILPVLVVLADYLENVTIASLAFRFQGQRSPWSTLASAFTTTKWANMIVVLELLFVGLVWKLALRRGRDRAGGAPS